ncbi:MAG: Gfo/Idh/MocA family protein [Planctomycetota bacterium]|jgi:predicted dehydrogenase
MTSPTRREFVKTSTAAAAATAFPLGMTARAWAGGDDTIGIGVVGTGGRGTGACNDALSVNEGVRLVAMGDLDAGNCRRARANLSRHGEKVQVSDENIFEGLDAYKKVINHPDVDVVILTTSPGFRPVHLAEAVSAGKHSFVEKPVCVDPAGYRSCMASGEIARKKNLAIVTGTMYRRQDSYMEGVQRVRDGMIGDLTGGLSYYCSTGIWYRPREDEQSELAYQLKNWYHFVWLSGDQIVEQAVHNLDAVNWAMGGPPVKAFGSGGQMTRPGDSEIYDNINIDYEYPNGALISFKCRQIPGSQSRVINTFTGTKGVAYINPGNSRINSHDGETLYRVEKRNNPYQQEHADLIASIRSGNPIMEIRECAESSLTAVMGRLAAYSGKEVTWDFVTNSTLDLMPPDLHDGTPAPQHGLAVPGTVKLA